MCNIPVSVRRENGGNSLKIIKTKTTSITRNSHKCWKKFLYEFIIDNLIINIVDNN